MKVIELIWDAKFKRHYRKKVKSNKTLRKRFWEAIELFIKDPFAPQLRTHKLSGKLEGLWALSVSYECRVVFKFLDEELVLLIDIGDHDEIY